MCYLLGGGVSEMGGQNSRARIATHPGPGTIPSHSLPPQRGISYFLGPPKKETVTLTPPRPHAHPRTKHTPFRIKHPPPKTKHTPPRTKHPPCELGLSFELETYCHSVLND